MFKIWIKDKEIYQIKILQFPKDFKFNKGQAASKEVSYAITNCTNGICRTRAELMMCVLLSIALVDPGALNTNERVKTLKL